MVNKYITVEKLIKVLLEEKADSFVLISVTNEDKSSTVGMPVSEIYTGIQLGNRGGIMLVADLRVKDSMYE